MSYKVESQREKYEILRQQLDNDRSSFIPLWRDINNVILPSAGRFFLSDVNRGDRRNLDIINSAGSMAAKTCRAGMMSGISSPSKPWFRIAAPDDDLNEYGPVKEWNELIAKRMRNIFLRSNLYKNIPYRDLSGFGTAPMSVEENFENVIHTNAYPVGSYWIAKDDLGRVNVFMREWQMTVRNIVSKFGKRDQKGNVDWSNISNLVKTCYDNGQYETYITIVYVVCPNENYRPGSPFSKHKKYSSCYYERGSAEKTGNRNYMDHESHKMLSESGFDYFPVLCPRWDVAGEDTYATDCPGITALGDVKQLQHSEKKFGKALDKMVDPTMIYPTSMANQKTSMLPGGSMFVDLREGMQGIRSAYDVNLRIDHLDNKISKIEQRISRAFYEDLFLMLAQSDRREITAREIEERHEEKLLALGPVLEQLNQDMLDPLIDITFDIMNKQGLIPPPPEELQGQKLRVEYISVMAQAQKMMGVAVKERFLGTALQIVQITGKVPNKIDLDQFIDDYAEDLSIPAKIVRTDEVVAEMVAAEQQAMQAQAMAENIPSLAGAAKNLSETDMSKDSALKAMVNG